MAAAGASGAVSGGGGGGGGGGGDDSAARLRLMCSHGGRFVPCGPDGGLRYVGGETRVLVVPREVPFRELAARLEEIAGALAAVRYRLVDEGLDDVLVSVTCDDELAHMRDEYDHLRATRPSASFRVFVSTVAGAVQQRAAGGLPPLAPTMRRAQSEQVLAARPCLQPHAAGPEPMRRVHSAQELAGGMHLQPCYYHRRHQCCCCCRRRRDICAPVPQLARPMYPLPSMSKNANGLRPRGHEPAPAVSAAKATGQVIFTEAAREKARCRNAEVAMQKGRAFWEFE